MVMMTIWSDLTTVLLLTALCGSVAEPEVIKNGHPPTLHELRHFPVKDGYKDLVAEIKSDYQIFGTLLLKDEIGNIVAGIERAKQGNPEDITVEVLHQWLQEKGRMPVMWETLEKCLREANLNAVAGYIEDALSQQHSSKRPQKQPVSGHTIQENGGTVGIRKINKRKIEVKFASLLTNVRKKLREKQINSEDLSFLANSIFLREYIPKSSSVNEIFEIMNHHRLWDYWNYYLLEEFIHFATDDPEAKAMVETYRQDLDSYKVTKTIIDHVDSFNETPEEKGQLNQLARYDQLCYKNLSMKIQMNFTDHSLKYIDDLWNRYANLYGLPPHVALLDHIQKGCFSIVWLIPSHLAAQICDAAPPLSSDFYRKHEITRVEIDGRCIYDEEEDCHDIHHVHVDKERDEEPVAAELQGIALIVIAIVFGIVVILVVKKYTATPPKVTFQPVSLKNILPGRKVSFSIQATGTLPLNYQWQWKQFGKEGEWDEWQNLTCDGGMLQKPATELKLASVQKHDAGYYRCVVSNCAGSTPSQCARLTVVPELVELVDELQDVIDWMSFGLYLGIRMSKLESIKVDCQTLAERRIQMLSEWQKNVTPTWSAAVQALAVIEMRHLASDLAQKHGVPPPKLPKPLRKLPQQEKLTGSRQETKEHRDDVSQDRKTLIHAEEHLEHAQELKAEADKKASEVVTKVEKLRKKVQKISQEKSSLEMELKFKEREYQMMLSAMHEKDEVYNQFLRKKISKKKEKIKKLKEELRKKEYEFQSAHQEAQTLQNELSLAQLELKKKHEEVTQLQREKEKLASLYRVEQFNKLSIRAADHEEMKQQLASMKYESELKSQQIEAYNVNINHLSEQMEALASSLHDKKVAVTQLQSELQTYQQVINSPEQLLKWLKLTTQIAELEHKLQEVEYQKQQAELRREAAVKARQNLEVQLHAQLSDI